VIEGPNARDQIAFYARDCHSFLVKSTAISRKVVGKSARDNPEKYCGWF